MNDIGVKIVDSPKDRLAVGASPGESGDNEVDPLSIDGGDVGFAKDPLTAEVKVKTEADDAGNCDDNAKEESVSEADKESSEDTKDNILKEDGFDISKVKEEIVDTVEVTDNDSKSPAEQIVTVSITDPAPSQVELKSEENEEPDSSCLKNLPDITSIRVGEPRSLRDAADVEMTEVFPAGLKIEKEEKPNIASLNGEVSKDGPMKRRASEENDTESPLKKLRQDVERTYPPHDNMINDYIQTATRNNIDEIQRHTEQLLSEIQTLREMAQKKEHEWNNVLHLKKVKEEILLRLLRRKQVLSFEKIDMICPERPERPDPFDYHNQPRNLPIDKSEEMSGMSMKQPGSAMMNPVVQAPVMPVGGPFNPMAGLPPPYDKAAHMPPMPKPVFPQPLLMPGPMPGFPRDMNGQLPSSYMPMGRQGPTKDVKSIIADYRQRNPDVTPRRGRRMKSILNPNMMTMNRPIAPKIEGLNNLNNLNMLFSNIDMNQKNMMERLQQMQSGTLPNGLSFKDVLVQFANMQQATAGILPSRPVDIQNRPEHHVRPDGRRRQERNHEDPHASAKQAERLASPSPRLPPPPPYPEISLLPVTSSQDNSQSNQQNSLLHGILTKQVCPASQSYSPTLAKLLTLPDQKQSATTLPPFGQAKNCGEITITPVQPTPPPAETQTEKTEVVQLQDDEESPGSAGSAASHEAGASPAGSGSGSGGRLVIDEAADDAPLCQGCRRRDAQFVCAGCANQWYCSRDCQVAAWDDHSEMCTG